MFKNVGGMPPVRLSRSSVKTERDFLNEDVTVTLYRSRLAPLCCGASAESAPITLKLVQPFKESSDGDRLSFFASPVPSEGAAPYVVLFSRQPIASPDVRGDYRRVRADIERPQGQSLTEYPHAYIFRYHPSDFVRIQHGPDFVPPKHLEADVRGIKVDLHLQHFIAKGNFRATFLYTTELNGTGTKYAVKIPLPNPDTADEELRKPLPTDISRIDVFSGEIGNVTAYQIKYVAGQPGVEPLTLSVENHISGKALAEVSGRDKPHLPAEQLKAFFLSTLGNILEYLYVKKERIHGDLNPGNVTLTSTGKSGFVDSSYYPAGSDPTGDTAVCVHTTPPETVCVATHDFAAGDFWALGLLLLKAVTKFHVTNPDDFKQREFYARFFTEAQFASFPQPPADLAPHHKSRWLMGNALVNHPEVLGRFIDFMRGDLSAEDRRMMTKTIRWFLTGKESRMANVALYLDKSSDLRREFDAWVAPTSVSQGGSVAVTPEHSGRSTPRSTPNVGRRSKEGTPPGLSRVSSRLSLPRVIEAPHPEVHREPWVLDADDQRYFGNLPGTKEVLLHEIF